MDEIATQLDECNAQLKRLPPVITTEPAAFVLNLVTAFCAEVKLHVAGSPDYARLVQTNKEAFEGFMRAVQNTTPLFVPFQREKDALPRAPVDDTYSDEDNEGLDDAEGSTDSDAMSDIDTDPKALYLEDLRDRIES